LKKPNVRTPSSYKGGMAKRIPPCHACRSAQYAEFIIGRAFARPVGYCAYGLPEISIVDSYGFNPRELSTILRVVAENRDLILRAWHDHFGNQRPL
jgi:Domain of unknown function (DUF4160)